MKKTVKRYRGFLILFVIMIVFTMINYEIGMKAFGISANSFKEVLFLVPPIFVILGLLDVWVPREFMVKYMGEGSGIRGVIISFLLGSAAAGPLYGAFPVAAVFMKKGVSFSNILIFIGAWSTTKIPMFLFEVSSLGPKFAFTRLLINIPGIIIIALILKRFVTKYERKEIYLNAENVDS